jgi:hypothetical protein
MHGPSRKVGATTGQRSAPTGISFVLENEAIRFLFSPQPKSLPRSDPVILDNEDDGLQESRPPPGLTYAQAAQGIWKQPSRSTLCPTTENNIRLIIP